MTTRKFLIHNAYVPYAQAHTSKAATLPTEGIEAEALDGIGMWMVQKSSKGCGQSRTTLVACTQTSSRTSDQQLQQWIRDWRFQTHGPAWTFRSTVCSLNFSFKPTVELSPHMLQSSMTCTLSFCLSRTSWRSSKRMVAIHQTTATHSQLREWSHPR